MAETPESAVDTPKSSDTEPDCLCPLGGVMDLLSRRYAMQTICVVGTIGPARYGEIEDLFEGVSSSTLSTRLGELVEAGVLSREQYAEIPPRVEYELTETGEELGRHLEPLLRWAEDVEEESLSVSQD